MHKRSVLLAAAVLVFLNLAVGAVFLFHAPKRPQPLSASLAMPQRALEKLRDARAVYFTPAAQAALRAQRPDLLAAAEEREFARAAQDTARFRQLDRRAHFDAALLCGDPASFRPLLTHLLDSRDWVLTDLDAAALVFRRAPAAPWSGGIAMEETQKWTAAERAWWSAAVAGKLLAIGKTGQAKSLLDEALKLDRDAPGTWTQLALCDVKMGRWPEAMAAADEALSRDENFAPALAAKAEILFGARRFAEAGEISRRLLEVSSNDPSALFLDAKIAHESHDFARETAALRRLVALADKLGEPAGGYRIFLGQALARAGQGAEALEIFRRAAEADELSPGQQAFIQECVARITAHAAAR